ncbi:hypothetical protein LguiB_032330 [Lonicera macranthoides]
MMKRSPKTLYPSSTIIVVQSLSFFWFGCKGGFKSRSTRVGCDGSILLEDTKEFKGEQTTPPNNNSLRGFDVIDRIKTMIESSCEGIVSCTDVLAVAARDAITMLGGPSYEVVLGRRDSRSTSLAAVNGQLPGPSFNVSQLISAFGSKGFTAEEMVVLLGAHTIGQARCSTFRARISNDTNIDKEFARALRSACNTNDENLAALSASSPEKFDNGYYKGLMAHRGLLHSDQELYNGVNWMNWSSYTQ